MDQYLHNHPYTFEKAREAVVTLQALRSTLSSSEVETLSLLMDAEALQIIEESVEEAEKKEYTPFEDAMND